MLVWYIYVVKVVLINYGGELYDCYTFYLLAATVYDQAGSTLKEFDEVGRPSMVRRSKQSWHIYILSKVGIDYITPMT